MTNHDWKVVLRDLEIYSRETYIRIYKLLKLNIDPAGKPMKMWKSIHDKTAYKFFMVGAANAFLAYCTFAGLYYLLNDEISIIYIVVAAHLLTSIWGYWGLGKFVFRNSQLSIQGFARYQLSLAVPFTLNVTIIPTVVYGFGTNAYIAQAVFTVVLATYSFFAHKYFTFRKKKS